jgi:putative glycosyltransferase (TIGR04372 family)
VPIIFLNWAPLVCSPVKAENWYLPKRYRRLGTGEVVSQRELLARGLGPVEFEHALRGHGLAVEDNAPEEIVEAVSHFYAHVVQGQALPTEDAEVQRGFAEAARRAGVVGAGTVAPGFARRHPEAW